jgi:hypothetical protein
MTNTYIPREARIYFELAERAYQNFDYKKSIEYRKLAQKEIEKLK